MAIVRTDLRNKRERAGEICFSQNSTGFFYAAEGAHIDRLQDRVFIGDAAANSGENVASGGDWLAAFLTGTLGRASSFMRYAQAAVLQSVAAGAKAANALVVGAQTNHFSSVGNAIGTINVGVNNNSTQATNAYASYNEAYRMSGSIGGAYGYEIDTVNYAGSVSIDPFSQDGGQTIGLQMAAGAELPSAGQFPSSACINIRKNGATYLAGIIFGNDAIEGTDGTSGEGEAIALATGHVINYFYAAGSISWQLRAKFGVNGDYVVTTSGTGAFSVPRLKANSIAFPAAQVASSDVNTLDDYEEGTFTPVILFGGASTGVTYSKQVGRYTKIGNVVTVAVEIILTSKGTATGIMEVNGMPFTVGSVGSAAAVRCANLAASATSDLQGLFGATTTNATITRFAAGAAAQLTDADLTNTSVIRIAGSYFVD